MTDNMDNFKELAEIVMGCHDDDCNDGVNGSYKPQRKIEFLKARLAMIVDHDLYQHVGMDGVLSLAAKLNQHSIMLFSTDSDFIRDFTATAEKLEGLATLYAPEDNSLTTFKPICSPKAAKIPKNRIMTRDTDILASFADEDLLYTLCDVQVKNELSLIPLPVTDMLILKSITTVQPYDLPLARHYLRQYTDAKKALSPEDFALIREIKEKGLPTSSESYNNEVRSFLKIEKKLYLQYMN